MTRSKWGEMGGELGENWGGLGGIGGKLGGGWKVRKVKTNVRFGILRFCRCQKWSHTPRLDLGHQRYNWVLKWVLVRNAAFCCARRCKIWIPETEYYQIVSSHAQIWPQGAEEQQSKVNVGRWVGGGGGMRWLPRQFRFRLKRLWINWNLCRNPTLSIISIHNPSGYNLGVKCKSFLFE